MNFQKHVGQSEGENWLFAGGHLQHCSGERFGQACGSAFISCGSRSSCFFYNSDPDPAALSMRIRLLKTL